MLTASATLVNALNNGYALKAQPQLIAEWNQNRYAGIQEVDNTPSEDTTLNDLDLFPISSIIKAPRPGAGINKARTNESYSSPDYTSAPPATRYYTVSKNNYYKYWSSYTTTNGANVFTTPLQPHVIYTADTWVNKLVVCVENGFSSPVSWTIEITLDGTSWTVVSTNPTLDSDGRAIIYRQANGTWSTTVNRDNAMKIRGMRITVNSLNKPNTHFNLIELSPRLETDLSPYLISYTSDFTQSETNFITPMGKASSNTGSVELSNLTGMFNNDDPTSMYYKMIDKNIRMTLDLIYDLTSFGGTTETQRVFTMWTDDWSGQGADSATASLKDSSKFFQEEKAPDLFLPSISAAEVIWRICDFLGFEDYIYQAKDTSPTTHIDYFWCTKDDTAWDVFSKLAEGTQTAIWFNQYDKLMIQTRDMAYDSTRAVDWNFQATNNNGKLADIVSMEESYEFEANKVNVNYKETTIPETNTTDYMQSVWEPDGDFVLRSSSLAATMNSTDMIIRMSSNDAVVWPFEGVMQIEGELIKYKGKEYSYTDKTTHSIKYVVVNSKEEQDNVDKNMSDPLVSYKNMYTGKIIITKRGYLWTTAMAHSTAPITTYYTRRTSLGNMTTTQSYYTHDVANSIMKLHTNSTWTLNDYYVMSHGESANPAYPYLGTRLRIPKVPGGTGAAGFAFNLGTNDAGYYIEVTTTDTLSANAGYRRGFSNEVAVYARYSDGSTKRLGSNGGLGNVHAIGTGLWYDIDVAFKTLGDGTHSINVFLNGIITERITVPVANIVTPGQRHGMYVRGNLLAEYEYIYGVQNGNYSSDVDDVSNYDRIREGFTGGQWDRSAVYGFTGKWPRKVPSAQKALYNNYLFDDFGPFIHEVREMDVAFTKIPVSESYLYNTNDTQSYCVEYNGTPFGAKFVIVNAYRENAVLNGEDNLTLPGQTLQQKILIYGRALLIKDSATYTAVDGDLDTNLVKNDDQIRRAGIVEVDVDSDWIQSKAAAKALADWIITNWSGGCDQIDLEVFGNPLFVIGDLVTIDYPDKKMTAATNKYFVVGVSNDWSDGPETKLTLRRARI
jgi:hypothetical protein